MLRPVRLFTAAAAAIGVTLSAVLLAALCVTRTDPERYPDFGTGLWWAVTTITTVGYGDVVPSSPEGRLTGSILMFVGIACVALLTAIATSAIVAVEVRSEEEAIESDELEILDELRMLNQRLDRLERAIRTTPPPTNGQPIRSSRRGSEHEV
ncbi:MAG TPA: potassium channel family protein [Nocardioidaceae bacterium]|nr:potassium channel family protein [Nocardioidaceae bacterium]